MDVDAARKHAGLTEISEIIPTNKPAKTDVFTEDATIGNEERLRGIPAVGRVAGTIRGTAPGDSAAELERAGRDIVHAKINRHRYKPCKEER